MFFCFLNSQLSLNLQTSHHYDVFDLAPSDCRVSTVDRKFGIIGFVIGAMANQFRVSDESSSQFSSPCPSSLILHINLVRFVLMRVKESVRVSEVDTRKPRKRTCTCWTFSYCFCLEIAPPSNSTVAGEGSACILGPCAPPCI